MRWRTRRAGASRGTIDLVPSFAVPIPALTISTLLGIELTERDRFLALCRARFNVLEGVGDSLGSISQSLEYLSEHRRPPARPNPAMGSSAGSSPRTATRSPTRSSRVSPTAC